MTDYKLEKKRIIFNAHYKHSVDFFQKQYDIMKEVADEMPDYHIGNLDCTVEDRERHFSRHFTHKRSIFEFDDINDKLKEVKESILKGLNAYNKFVPVENYSSLILRTFMFVPMKEIKINELADIYWSKLYKGAEVKEILGEAIDDLAYTVDFSEGELFYKILSGPMPKDQIAAFVDFGDQNKRFSDSTKLKEFMDSFSDISIFIDLTCGKKDIAFNEKENFVQKAFERTNQIASNFKKYLIG